MYDVSICIPYFDRMELLENTLTSFEDAGYGDVEICICDDGSTKEPLTHHWLENWPTLNIHVTRLGSKSKWMNNCVPLNVAVGSASAPVILLQSPETKHTGDLITPMLACMKDRKDVVLGCCKEGDRWLAHPVYRNKRWWFCQMMAKEFFDEVGGWDENFRDVDYFDDDDFEIRLTNAGANWIWREDCVSIHQKHSRKDTRHVAKNREMTRMYFKEKHGRYPDG